MISTLSMADWMAVASVLTQIACAVVAVVWAVASIRSTTKMLESSIDRLSQVVRHLDECVEKMRWQIAGLEARVRMIEQVHRIHSPSEEKSELP